MKPAARHQWIVDWMRSRGEHSVDVLRADFVADYAEATKAKVIPQFFGAQKCKQLGRDLGCMYKNETLKRVATGLPAGDSSMGFPKWVWSYSLKDES